MIQKRCVLNKFEHFSRTVLWQVGTLQMISICIFVAQSKEDNYTNKYQK